MFATYYGRGVDSIAKADTQLSQFWDSSDYAKRFNEQMSWVRGQVNISHMDEKNNYEFMTWAQDQSPRDPQIVKIRNLPEFKLAVLMFDLVSKISGRNPWFSKEITAMAGNEKIYKPGCICKSPPGNEGPYC